MSPAGARPCSTLHRGVGSITKSDRTELKPVASRAISPYKAAGNPRYSGTRLAALPRPRASARRRVRRREQDRRPGRAGGADERGSVLIPARDPADAAFPQAPRRCGAPTSAGPTRRPTATCRSCSATAGSASTSARSRPATTRSAAATAGGRLAGRHGARVDPGRAVARHRVPRRRGRNGVRADHVDALGRRRGADGPAQHADRRLLRRPARVGRVHRRRRSSMLRRGRGERCGVPVRAVAASCGPALRADRRRAALPRHSAHRSQAYYAHRRARRSVGLRVARTLTSKYFNLAVRTVPPSISSHNDYLQRQRRAGAGGDVRFRRPGRDRSALLRLPPVAIRVGDDGRSRFAPRFLVGFDGDPLRRPQADAVPIYASELGPVDQTSQLDRAARRWLMIYSGSTVDFADPTTERSRPAHPGAMYARCARSVGTVERAAGDPHRRAGGAG